MTIIRMRGSKKRQSLINQPITPEHWQLYTEKGREQWQHRATSMAETAFFACRGKKVCECACACCVCVCMHFQNKHLQYLRIWYECEVAPKKVQTDGFFSQWSIQFGHSVQCKITFLCDWLCFVRFPPSSVIRIEYRLDKWTHHYLWKKVLWIFIDS